jgi:hypothetical protein
MSVVETMGRGAMAVALVFLIGWGLMKGKQAAEPQAPETD